MIVLMPFHEGDREQHNRVHQVARSQRGRHQIFTVFCPPSGAVPEWDFVARPVAGPATCAWLIFGMMHRLPYGSTFLWLEPDCCLTSHDSFNQIEAGFNAELARNPDVCIFGHDKRDQWHEYRFVSGVSVYRTIPPLLDAANDVRKHGPHDEGLGKRFLGTSFAKDTPLIRCVWKYESDAYLSGFKQDPAVVLEYFTKTVPQPAALIHGDKDGRIHELVWGKK